MRLAIPLLLLTFTTPVFSESCISDNSVILCDNGIDGYSDGAGNTVYSNGESSYSDDAGNTSYSNGDSSYTDKGGATVRSNGSVCFTDDSGYTFCE